MSAEAIAHVLVWISERGMTLEEIGGQAVCTR
jgi:hypothetical protein